MCKTVLSDHASPTYLSWNDALAGHFFSPAVAHEPVYLFVTGEVLDEVGGGLGGAQGFLDAVRTGPPGATRQGHCQRALQIAAGWRARGFPFPPYIAYLSLFVLAGGHEGDFDPRSYYPRLWDLLGEDCEGTPPSFSRMWELWYDLEQWSIGDRRGELGLFQVPPAGHRVHIGFPLAQTMLTEEERHALPRIFADAGLEPGTSPSGRELRRALSTQGRYALRRRTLSALQASTSYTEGLLDAVSDYFLEWDGGIPEEPGRPEGRARITAGLRLSLRIDRVARRADVALRCRTKRDFPETPLELDGAAQGPVTCNEFTPGWSGLITSLGSGAPFVPPHRAWVEGLALRDTDVGWGLRLHPAKMRVFANGSSEQLPDLIEILEFPRGKPFYLAFHATVRAALIQWIESDCSGWQPLSLDGIPPDWTFGCVDIARSDRGPRAVDSRLGFPDRRTIRLAGGIAGDVRGDFLAFAPPRVFVDGALSDDVVVCSGHRLAGDAASGWTLPAGLPLDTQLELEVKCGAEVVRRRRLQLVSGFSWRVNEPLAVCDAYGRVSADTERGIAGAVILPRPCEVRVPIDLLRTPGFSTRSPRVYFIGRRAGEISTWPEEPIPDWPAVWAVPYGRRGCALFCGDSMEGADPLPGSEADRERIRLWQEVLWWRRKRITPPPEKVLKPLWQRYTEAARNA